MNEVRCKADRVTKKEGEGIRSSSMPLSCATLLACLFVFIVLGSVKAAVFNVAAGDVYGPNGLVAAINAANSNADSNNIVLEPGTPYTLTRVDNDTDGRMSRGVVQENYRRGK
jgi:hypothetical protein